MASLKEIRKKDKLLNEILNGLEEIKGKDITVLNLGKLKNTVCKYFVICTGGSNTQVRALADSVEEEVRENIGEKPWHIEGMAQADWVLMDYVDIVAHIFRPETRAFFNIEELWGDAEIYKLEETN
jgi:ribosome-associated protein